MRRAVPVLGPLLTLAVLAPAPAAATVLHCGDTVTGNVRLGRDLDCTGRPAGLHAGADGVTIDLGGHTLSAADGQGTGIAFDGHAAVRVRRGTVAGFELGVLADGPGAILQRVATLAGDVGVRVTGAGAHLV